MSMVERGSRASCPGKRRQSIIIYLGSAAILQLHDEALAHEGRLSEPPQGKPYDAGP